MFFLFVFWCFSGFCVCVFSKRFCFFVVFSVFCFVLVFFGCFFVVFSGSLVFSFKCFFVLVFFLSGVWGVFGCFLLSDVVFSGSWWRAGVVWMAFKEVALGDKLFPPMVTSSTNPELTQHPVNTTKTQ